MISDQSNGQAPRPRDPRALEAQATAEAWIKAMKASLACEEAPYPPAADRAFIRSDQAKPLWELSWMALGDPDQALNVCIAIAEMASDPPIVRAMATATLEDLLVRASADQLDRVARSAQRSPGVAQAVRYVYALRLQGDALQLVQRLRGLAGRSEGETRG